MITEIGAGDVWAAAPSGEDPAAACVVIVHHVDKAARWWGIRGHSGGAGWADLRQYRRRDGEFSKSLVSTAALPRTDQQRQLIAVAALALVSAPDAWLAGPGAEALGLHRAQVLAGLLDGWWGWPDPAAPESAPGHVAAASLAAWMHQSLGLDGPDAGIVQPAGWQSFSQSLPQTGDAA